MELVQDVDVLVSNQYYWAGSDDKDDFGIGRLHLGDLVRVEMWQTFRKKYQSQM
jgi:hypothetical protein